MNNVEVTFKFIIDRRKLPIVLKKIKCHIFFI